MWSTDLGPPPAFTPVSNGIIELLVDHYYLSVYRTVGHISPESMIVIDVSRQHGIFKEFPGPSIGRIICGPEPTAVVVASSNDFDALHLDAADPDSMHRIERFFAAM